MSIRLSRKKINDMVDRDYSFSSSRSGGGSGAGGGGGVSSQWVDDHYVSKEFFARLFTINGTDDNDDDVVVEPNDLETSISNIQMMVGAWTESYLSALGLNSGGGGGGGSSTLYDLNDVQIPAVMSQANDGQVLMYSWSARKWINSSIGTGTITDVTLEMPTGFDVSHSTVGSTVQLSVGFGDTLTKNQVLATPSDVDGSPLWRSLVLDDLPDIPWSKIGDDSKPLSWWGQNTWDANGALTGSLSDVTNINSLLYFDMTYGGIGINTASVAEWNRSFKLRVNGDMQVTHVETTSFGGEKTDTWTDANNNAHLWYGYDHRHQNTGVYSTSFSDYFGMTFHTASGWISMTGDGKVGIGTTSPSYLLDVNGYASVTRLYLAPNVYLEYDSSKSGVQLVGAGFYTNSYVSALGANSQGGGGGGVSLNTLLTSLNSTSLNPATVSNKVLVNSSGTWTWQNYTSATGTVTSVGMTVPTGFSVSPSSITSSGTFAVNFGGSVTKNYVLASPSSAAGAPSWRALVAADIPSLDASKITSGTFADARIPSLAASKITSGTFDAARIPNLSASKITSGTLDAARIPDLSGTYATDARMDTVEGYFNSSGYANTAVKLSTVSKTLWGNTYWTSGGVPTSVGVSGTPASLSYVGSISMAGDITGAGDITMGNKAQPKLTIGQDNTYYIRKASSSTLGYGIAIRAGGTGEQFAVYSTKTYTNKQLHTTIGLLSDGYVTALSDIRYKDVVAKVSPMVEDIAKASIIRYTWKFHADKTIHIGGIAQEWKVILPETVIDSGDKLSMDYGKIGAIAGIANARRIVDHETRIKQLEQEIFLLKQGLKD